jgi:hypothetical protein
MLAAILLNALEDVPRAEDPGHVRIYFFDCIDDRLFVVGDKD